MRSTKPYFLAGLFLILSGLIFLSACSTKKNTFTRRTYHNLTSHYNVYWNGMDNLRQGVKELEAGIKDNFSVVIPVFNFGDKATGGKMAQFADIAIKKSSKAINKHSMVFNRKENVRWIDDAYLLIGKSYFYKQDYAMARRTFEFVIKTYNENDIKYEAMLWQALSNIQYGDYNRAEPMLDMLQSKITQGKAPGKYETDLNLAYAQFYILQKNYENAVPYIERALELNPDRKTRTRCLFILAQISQKNGNLAEASALYAQVIRRTPSYDMEFNAKINLAQCYDAKSGDREFIVKKLMRMLKDDKNKDYQDQIYYALSHIALSDADTLSGVEYLKKSVSTSRTNNYQKAISSLELADIYFAGRNYPQAQAYYDSTMQFLPKDYPNYKELQKKTNTLTDLVTNLQIISRQDSLQGLATMSEEKRNRIIDEIIAKLIAEEVRRKQEEQDKKDNVNLFGQNRDPQPGSSPKEGRWYFYNPSLMSSGYSTFVRKFGRRKFEDNWFLTDKQVVAFVNETNQDSVMMAPGDSMLIGGKPVPKTSNPKDRNFYLQDVPFTPDQIAASNGKIIQALYETGFIYVEGLNDYPNSISTFETLLDRFPENKYKVQSYFKLYQLYKALENQPKTDQYKNILLDQYAESDYAKLLVNPDYYKEILSKQSAAEELYEDTYKAFTNQQFYMVINNAGIAHANYLADTNLMPKFDYLRALALGKIEVVDSMAVAMYKVIQDYPKSPVKKLAENILTSLGNQRSPSGQPLVPDSITLVETTQKLYKTDENAIHFFVLVVDGQKVDVDALKIKIADFNTKYHDLENLQVNSLLFDNNREMITVNNFTNGEKAVSYLFDIRNSKYIYTKLETSGDYSDFVISVENYPVLYRNKDISQYLRFFERNYPVK